MTVFEWLEQPWPPHGTVLNRLAELVHANGGFGILEENVQSTGRRGLNHEEALELANMNGILKRFRLSSGKTFHTSAAMNEVELALDLFRSNGINPRTARGSFKFTIAVEFFPDEPEAQKVRSKEDK